MDVVGQLPTTAKGNRFILVISDYARKYPEAIPLRRVTVMKIDEELTTLFSKFGIPEEILADQGANFTSSLLGEIYWMMGISGLSGAPTTF